MRRFACLIGCAAAGAAIFPGAALAAPRALLDAPRAEDVAVAGGEVLVSEATARGKARLTAVPLAGGPARRVLTARPPGRGEYWTSRTRLASSAQLTALLVEFTDSEGTPRDWRVYAGPPSGPLAIVHRARLERQRRLWIPIELDVHGDRLLIQEIRLPLRDSAGPDILFRLTVHAPGASSPPLLQRRYGAPAVVAGDRLAYVRSRRPPLIRIIDWRSGHLADTIGLGRRSGEIMERHLDEEIEERHLDLGEDGRAVVELDGDLFAGAPGGRARPLPGTAGVPDLSAPQIVGERVAALAEARLDTLRVTCVAAPPPGCRGAVVLGFGGRAGQGRFRVAAGRQRLVQVRLTRRGLAAIRRQHGYDGVALLRLGARMADGRISREGGTGWVLVDRPR